MLEGAILSLYLFAHPTLQFNTVQSANIIEEIKNTHNTYKVAEAIRRDEKMEMSLHRDQILLANNKKEDEEVVEEEWLLFEVSAYTNNYESTQRRKGDKYYGVTASGARTKQGRTVSADKMYPFGTILYIDGVGERVVEDRGGAIKGQKLDLFIEDLQEAREFGRKFNVKVKVIKWGEKN